MLVLSQLFLRSFSFLTKANAHCAWPRGKMEQSLGKGIQRKTKGHISNLKSKTLERCFQIIRFNRWARQHAQPLASRTYHANLRRAYHCWNPGRAGLCAAAAAAMSCQGDKASLPLGHGGWKKLLQDQLNWNVWRQERLSPKIWLKVCELTAQMVQREQMPWNEATCVSLAHVFSHPPALKCCLGHLMKRLSATWRTALVPNLGFLLGSAGLSWDGDQEKGWKDHSREPRPQKNPGSELLLRSPITWRAAQKPCHT